jgi:hypothetical protein
LLRKTFRKSEPAWIDRMKRRIGALASAMRV